jgi:dolichyl-phosphate-mannose--protein O-mannosyl transferase
MVLALLFSAAAALAPFEGQPGDVPLSYYSMVKLMHTGTGLWLSSFEIGLETGSRQQLTRGLKFPNPSETFWTVFPGLNLTHPRQGEPLKCGDRIRLYHATTRVWLQAREFPSPFDHGFEVSGADGDSDANDWIVRCEDDSPSLASFLVLRNALLPCALAADERSSFPEQKGGNFEVFCEDAADENTWVASMGIFVGGYADAEEDGNENSE